MANDVAPYTGAWIETDALDKDVEMFTVAPYTGAWIETDARKTS
ncbi:MAG: hypothetical protein ACP5NR_06375 [Athalassotoga sp.]